MNNIVCHLLTIFTILFFVFSARRGYQLGFFKKVLSIASLIIAILLTKTFTPNVVLLVKDYTNIKSTISNALYNVFKNSNSFDNVAIDGLQNIFNLGNMNESIQDFISNTITEGILTIFCGIVTFIAFMVLLKIIFRLLDFIDFVPVIGKLNKVLGGGLGLVEAIFLLWIVFLIIRILTIVPQVKTIEEYIDNSLITGAIYRNNLIYNFFANLFSGTKV